jgi:hypothetical protein
VIDETPIPKTERQPTTIEEWKRKLERIECPPRETTFTVYFERHGLYIGNWGDILKEQVREKERSVSEKTCDACKGQGITLGRYRLGLVVSILLDAGMQSLYPDTHDSLWADKMLDNDMCSIPTRDLGELTTALAGREPHRVLGHDDLDKYTAVDKIIQAAGFDPKVWGICPECKEKGQ